MKIIHRKKKMQDVPKITYNLTKKQHLDAPLFITKLNQWLKKNIKQFNEGDAFQICMFYPEYAKKELKLKPAMGEITIRPFKSNAGKNVPDDLILINVYKSKGVVPVFADKKEFFEAKITHLQFCDLKSPTLEQWKDSYHINSRCKTFRELSIMDMASQVIKLYELKEIPNLQELLCDMLWSIIGRETDEISKEELDVFVRSSFGIMFAEFEMFEELEEWLPGDVYDKVCEKLHNCQNIFREHLKKGIQSIRNPRIMKIFHMIAEISYGNGQFLAIDEPMLLGATMQGDSEGRFAKFWRECGGEILFSN